jgi:WD40-like Beta Propeller Repeat
LLSPSVRQRYLFCLDVKMKNRKFIFCLMVLVQIVSILACGGGSSATPIPQVPPTSPAIVDRETAIPVDAVKITPVTDANPPLLSSSDYESPVPVPGSVNTAGAEDSPFITPDGNTLYFFFTPDVNVPVERQLLDGITGIYVSKWVNGAWSTPARVILQDPGKLALDGCEFVLGEIMWFCSTREGFTGIQWFTADYMDGRWQNWTHVDFNSDYQVGELHITGDGTQLYFGSDRPGGMGQRDIWLSRLLNGSWQEPINVSAVNTADSEAWPALSPDETELWFNRNYGIWRSEMANAEWQAPELILSPLAGEPSIDSAGNIYFVHHFYLNDRMVEADIYVAYKK